MDCRKLMKKRLRKKCEPLHWGSIALICDDDVRCVKGALGYLTGPTRDVRIVFWSSRKQRKWKGKNSRKSIACYEEFKNPSHLIHENGRIEVGRLHFNKGDLSDETILHEVIHATCHAERIIGRDSIVKKAIEKEKLEEQREERLAYRAERIFSAIQEFRDDLGL